MFEFINRMIKRFLYKLRGDFTTEELQGRGLRVGKNFSRQRNVIIDSSHCWLITIGDNVTMAPRVFILAHDSSTYNHLGYTRIGRVDIGNNVFIGADTVVLPGVSIGDNSVIGANSTVTKNIPANVVAAGNPARVICSLDVFIDRNKKRMSEGYVYNEEYTLRKNVSDEKKNQQREELVNNIGFVE